MSASLRFFVFALAVSLTLPAIAQTRPKGVAEKGQQFNGNWYFAFSLKEKKTTWEQAAEFCRKRGGHLACLETEEERNFVNGILPLNGRAFWTGGYFAEGGWKWITGDPVNTEHFADRGKETADQRLLIKLASYDRAWRGLSGTAIPEPIKTGFVCEWPAAKIALTYPDGTATAGRSPVPRSAPNGLVEGNPHARAIELKKTQAKVKGLLVIPLGGDDYAGGASNMSLSAVGGEADKPATVGFNQAVGNTMATALKEVVRFTELRHDGWPKGRRMEIAFENKYSGKDGPSAAVACALLLESVFAGTELDGKFAVTGDLNADGSVQPIGGAAAKIRGATKRDCTHVAVPTANENRVRDLFLVDGFDPLTSIQVFSISTFDEALALASAKRSEDIGVAMDEFSLVQSIYRRNPKGFSSAVKHPKVVEKLRLVLEKAPNHLSADLLLAYATGKAPSKLSLLGSVIAIGDASHQFNEYIKKDADVAKTAFDDDRISAAMTELRRLHSRLDERTWDWANAITDLGRQLRQWQNDRPNSYTGRRKLVASINDAIDRVIAEREEIMSQPEVVEELSF